MLDFQNFFFFGGPLPFRNSCVRYFVVVIMVVSLLFPESSERAQKLLFWQCQKLLFTNYFFRVNKRRKGMDYFSETNLRKIFRNFEDILVRNLCLILICP